MRESRQTFWVGLFVLVGIAALCVLIILFGQIGFLGRRGDAYALNVRFDRATGIRRGTVVTIGGIEVGRVFAVRFADPNRFEQGVDVEVVFDRDVFGEGMGLPQGTFAKTSEPGLGMGRPPIRIQPGPADARTLESGAFIPGEISSAMESIIPKEIVANFDKAATQVGEAASALTPVLGDLHHVLEPRDIKEVDQPGGPSGNFATAATRLDSALKHFNEVLGDPAVKSKLRESIDNFHTVSQDAKVFTADMKEVMTDAQAAASEARKLINKGTDTLERIDGHADRVARSFTENMDLTSGVLTRMHSLVERADRGEGTVGRLFTDERLYEALVLTVRRVDELLDQFRATLKEWEENGLRLRGLL
jgi:phospholipid/cholesterol/gamma-HCH transport system substrate-binding protein